MRLREAIESFRALDEGQWNPEHPVYKQTYSAYRAMGEPHEHATKAAQNAMAHARPLAKFKHPVTPKPR